MYTPFLNRIKLQCGPYAHFGYWTLISDPYPNKVVNKWLKVDAQKVPKIQAGAKSILPTKFEQIKIPFSIRKLTICFILILIDVLEYE